MFQIPPLSIALDRAGRVKGKKMIECTECGSETIVIDGDSWDPVCKGCHAAYADDAEAMAEAEATGN